MPRPSFRRVALATTERESKLLFHRWNKNCCGEDDTQLQPLFRVTLRAQPSNAAIAIHPVISIRFVFQASDFPGVNARILSHNTPVVLRVSDDFESHFCFCHELLCMFFGKMEPLAARQVALTAIPSCGCVRTRRRDRCSCRRLLIRLWTHGLLTAAPGDLRLTRRKQRARKSRNRFTLRFLVAHANFRND